MFLWTRPNTSIAAVALHGSGLKTGPDQTVITRDVRQGQNIGLVLASKPEFWPWTLVWPWPWPGAFDFI